MTTLQPTEVFLYASIFGDLASTMEYPCDRDLRTVHVTTTVHLLVLELAGRRWRRGVVEGNGAGDRLKGGKLFRLTTLVAPSLELWTTKLRGITFRHQGSFSPPSQ